MVSRMKREKNEIAAAVIRAAGEKFGGTFICRDKVESFTGGALKSRNLANLDSLGQGPTGAFYLGRRRCYPVANLVEWLIDRMEV